MSMTEGQKCRTRDYLDDFKEHNGGCIICGRKISDYYFDPAQNEESQCPELHMYGSCAGHGMLSNSDELLAEAVLTLRPQTQAEAGKPVLMIVTFKENGEDLKYACTPVKKRK